MIWPLVSDCSWLDVRLFSWSVPRARSAVVESRFDVAGLDGAQLVAVERHDLVGLHHPTWLLVSATTPAVERPSSWSELMAATWAVVRRPPHPVDRALTWSELRPARAPVVMARRSAVSSLTQLGGRQGARLVGVQRRELGGAQGVQVAGRQVVHLLGRQGLDPPVVSLLIWSVVSVFRLAVVSALTCGALVSDAIWLLVSDCSWLDVRALTWSVSRHAGRSCSAT